MTLSNWQTAQVALLVHDYKQIGHTRYRACKTLFTRYKCNAEYAQMVRIAVGSMWEDGGRSAVVACIEKMAERMSK